MVRNGIIMFMGLVGLIFILNYPDKVVEMLQMIVDAAQSMARALSHVNVKDN